MKRFLYFCLALALLGWLAWRSGPTAIVGQLHEREILNEAGCRALRTRLWLAQLHASYRRLRNQPIPAEQASLPATVLAFCAEAFEAEQWYRMPALAGNASPVFLGGEELTPPEADEAQLRAQQRQFDKLLRRFGGDTAAVQRELYRQLPAQYHLEDKISAEDSVLQTGWTIMAALQTLPRQHWVAESRSTLGKTRSRTARDLHALGLLTNEAYQIIRTEISRGELHTEAQVCQRGSVLMLLASTYDARRTEHLTWLRQLHRAGLLTPAGLRQLSAAIGRYAPPKRFDALVHCPQARVLDLRRLPRDSRQLYPAILAELPAILPGFRYADLRVELRRLAEDSVVYENRVALSFTADGRRYRTEFLHDFERRDSTSIPTLGAEVGEDFRTVVNQWLADRDSPLRLYLAHTPDAQSVYGNERLGLVALTEAQRPLWGDETYFLTRESHDNSFNSGRVEALIKEAGELGLLSHLSKAERAAGRAQALSGQVAGYGDILRSFPRVLLYVDGESAVPPRPYAQLTRQLAEISRGAFQPTDVRDGFGSDFPTTPTVPFSFRHGGRLYRAELQVNSDWLDDDYFDLVARALRVPGSKGQFYNCLDGEAWIFLTPKQHEHLQRTQPALFHSFGEPGADEELPF